MISFWKFAVIGPWMIIASCLPVLAWWYWFEPVPVVVSYVAPKFARVNVDNRKDAEENSITEIRGGSVVYRFTEFCVRKSVSGKAVRMWVSESMVWNAPIVPTVYAGKIGCFSMSTPILTPSSNPSRSFMFHQESRLDTNPIRTDVIEFGHIPLKLLSKDDADAVEARK